MSEPKLVVDRNGNGKWVEECGRVPAEECLAQSFEVNVVPRLMIISKRHLSAHGVENLRSAIKYWESGNGRAVVVVEGLDVFQLIGGRWEPLVAPEPVKADFESYSKYLAWAAERGMTPCDEG
jgi:hypothetical protein